MNNHLHGRIFEVFVYLIGIFIIALMLTNFGSFEVYT